MKRKILFAEDEPIQRKMLSSVLKKLDYDVTCVVNGKEAIDQLRSETFSAIVLDLFMPTMDGFEALKKIRDHSPRVPVIILTADSDTELAVKAIKEGATHFIVKPPNPDQLSVILENAIKMSEMAEEISRLQRDKEGALTFSDLIGYNDGLAETTAYGRKAASSEAPTLIMGETGTGKELFARAIHGESKRYGAPFMAINCGALPENLVESILFGHEKGAFTGATDASIGKFREANGGTVFLDEIGELPLAAQVKLLRVLQQNEVEPVGGGRPQKVNVRIISATNVNLKQAVEEGHFREDLYFRLDVLPITLPPLRERGSDIIELATYFLKRFSDHDAPVSKKLSKNAEDYLKHYSWPGNVRELENLIRRASILCESDVIDKKELKQIHNITETPESRFATDLSISLHLQSSTGELKPMVQIEKEVIQMALDHHDNNITRAAESLGIAKSTFYRKIKELNLEGDK